MRALISVYRKEGVEELAKNLYSLGYEILSTGGTAKYLKDNGIPVVEVSSITGFPEILEGRVKTLHPAVHGGILYRDWVEKDREDVERLNIIPIDVVVVNLYPFEAMMKEELTRKELMEFIDIGGPALIRAAAKNFFRVVVLVDPQDYNWTIEKLKNNSLSEEDRAFLAWKAFSHTAYYDGVISNALKNLFEIEEVPTEQTMPMRFSKTLRYGENPHQKGYLYTNPFEDLGIAKASVLQGKEMSFNNYLDGDAALKLTLEFPNDRVCAIIKHNNPCGVALGNTPKEAFLRAKDTDPESAFGGIVAFNDTVDEETAKELSRMFLEVIIAPVFSPEAKEILSKKKNLRLVAVPGVQRGLEVKKISGGFLLQEEDTSLYESLEVVSKRRPQEREMEDLIFAWKVCKHVKSNAVVIAREGRTLAIGSGQVSRVDSLRCAIQKAKRYGFDLRGAVLASEAFFPFRDSVDIAAEEGISAIIHPAGSIRDKEVFQAADEHGIAMVITRMRHFKH
jgi:phosphoribosylaminoimidazolecarboxamide formyltransferase/IMP cyclohydrolase